MGKFGHFGIGRASEAGSENNAPLSKHPTAAHSAHAAGALHVAPRSAMASPSGKSNRYIEEEELDKQHMQIPAVVMSRLQPVQMSPPVAATAPALVPTHADGSQQQYSRLASKMITMVNELRATGADVALELPTIVVCGQQSAGKSSVVEAICGIPLPRNQETCTRCPTEVRLSQQPPANGTGWEAVVKLRRNSGQGGSLLQQDIDWHLQQNPTQQRQSPVPCNMTSPVASRPPSANPSSVQLSITDPAAADMTTTEVVFRSNISSPADLPAAVSAAQSALLMQRGSSAAGSPERRLSGPNSVGRVAAGVMAASEASTDAVTLLKFTRDVVVVEVRGAPVDLTLIDLPGIIHSVERPEDDHYKQLVSDLAVSYMKRAGVVIVATITCKEDIDTQVILSMAREADPRGERTLGVLTKPDQVEEGCHGQWLQVLAGERYPLALGWYVVRNPNQAALVRGTTSSMARQQEEVFFSNTTPWNRLPLASKSRLGTLKLREAMSKQLVKMVTAARPALMAAAQAQLITLRAELASMPPAVLGDGHVEMLRLIDDVSMTLQEEVLARSQSKQFYQHLLNNFQQLKKNLTASRPCFLLPRSAAGSVSSVLAVTCAMDDDLAAAEEARQQAVLTRGGGSFNSRCVRDDGLNPGTPTGNARAGPGSFDIFSNNSSGLVGSNGGNSTAKPGLAVFAGTGSSAAGAQSGAMLLAPSPYQVLLPLDSAEAERGMSLEDVRQLVDRHHSIELPGFSPYSAVQDLIAKHQQGWAQAVAECAGQAHRQLLHLVMAHVAKTFDRFPRAADHIRELATELLEELHTITTSAVESLVAMEMSGAFAVARREFSRASNQHLDGLKALLISAGGSNTAAAGAAVAVDNTAGSAVDGRCASGPVGSTANRNCSVSAYNHAVAAPVLSHTAGLYDPGVTLSPIPATATGPAELLSMMAVVLTYYSMSVRRLTDTVSMSIMHHLINSFTKQFRSRLANKLLSLSADAVGALLVEDAQSAAKRAALKAQKDMLEQALKVMRAAA